MKNKLFAVILFTLIIIISGGSGRVSDFSENGKARPVNIILFIGDGMGPAQLSAGITVSDHTLVVEKFPYAGLCKTSSSDNYITDSAAAGTAIATGVKTRNKMIGMGPDSTIVNSIMEVAHRNGLATGLVSTQAIIDATPASFVSHNSGRGNYEDIAKDFLNETIDVFIGGGSDYFNKRKDSTDITKKLKEQGYDVVYNLEDLKKSNSGRIAGLLAKANMGKANEGRAGMLEIMTDKAIEALSKNKKGFILMVEGGQIDVAGHNGNMDYLLAEVLDFDMAVKIGYDFAEKNGKTLIIVTADHETGALTLTGGSLADHKVTGNFASTNHTAVAVPVFSFGPGAQRFSGIHENTFFFNEFINLLNIKK
jgi:alkaline phosphatase